MLCHLKGDGLSFQLGWTISASRCLINLFSNCRCQQFIEFIQTLPWSVDQEGRFFQHTSSAQNAPIWCFWPLNNEHAYICLKIFSRTRRYVKAPFLILWTIVFSCNASRGDKTRYSLSTHDNPIWRTPFMIGADQYFET